MEQLNEEFVGSTWVETAATHAEAPGATEEFQRSQQQTNAGGDADAKPEPIRNRGATRRPQRSLPLRQRQEIQELLPAQRRRRMIA